MATIFENNQQSNKSVQVSDKLTQDTLKSILNFISSGNSDITRSISGVSQRLDQAENENKKRAEVERVASLNANKSSRAANNILADNSFRTRKSIDKFMDKFSSSVKDILGTLKGYAKESLKGFTHFAAQMRKQDVSKALSKELGRRSSIALSSIQSDYKINLDLSEIKNVYAEAKATGLGFEEMTEKQQQAVSLLMIKEQKTAAEAIRTIRSIRIDDENEFNQFKSRIYAATDSNISKTTKAMGALVNDATVNIVYGNRDAANKAFVDAGKAFANNMASINGDTAAAIALMFDKYKTKSVDQLSPEEEQLSLLVSEMVGSSGDNKNIAEYENIEQLVDAMARGIANNSDDIAFTMRAMKDSKDNSISDSVFADIHSLIMEYNAQGKLATAEIKTDKQRADELLELTPNGKLMGFIQEKLADLDQDGTITAIATELDNLFGEDYESIVTNALKLISTLLSGIALSELIKAPLNLIGAGVSWALGKTIFKKGTEAAAKKTAEAAAKKTAETVGKKTVETIGKKAAQETSEQALKKVSQETAEKIVKETSEQALKKVSQETAEAAAKKTAEAAAKKTVETVGKNTAKALLKFSGKAISGALTGVMAADVTGQIFHSKVMEKGGPVAEALQENTKAIGEVLPDFIDEWVVSKDTLALIKTNFDGSAERKTKEKIREIEEAGARNEARILENIRLDNNINQEMWEQFLDEVGGFEGFINESSKYGYQNLLGALSKSNNLEEYTQAIAQSSLALNVKNIADKFNVKLGSVYDRLSAIEDNTTRKLWANGGVVTSATPAVVGEAGKEAILPLTRPTQLLKVLNQLSSKDKETIAKALLKSNAQSNNIQSNTNNSNTNKFPNSTIQAEYEAAVAKLSQWQGGRLKPAEFISLFGPIAREDMRRSGIPASITLAQAALESGWGKTAKSSFRNLFGIKGKGNAGSALVWTHEIRDGGRREVKQDYFAQYASYLDSINAHSVYLLTAKRKKGLNGLRYGEALTHIFEPDIFAHKLKEGGYATSPTYAEKLINLMKGHNLYKWDVPAAQMDLQALGSTQAELINQSKQNAANPTTYVAPQPTEMAALATQYSLGKNAVNAIKQYLDYNTNISNNEIISRLNSMSNGLLDEKAIVAAIREVRDELKRNGGKSFAAVAQSHSIYA